MRISEEWAKGRLAAHEPYLAYCVHHGWQRFLREVPSTVRTDLTARGQANIVWDLMATVADVNVSATEGLYLKRSNNSMFIVVEDEVIVRFKKLNEGGESANIQTELQIEYRDQLPLPGLGDLPRLDVGYRLDGTGMDYEAVMVSCPSGRGSAWHYEIPRMKLEAFQPAAESEPTIVQVRAKHLRLIEDTGTDPLDQ